jgi:predicted GIY-YIG superfamily endonuclease
VFANCHEYTNPVRAEPVEARLKQMVYDMAFWAYILECSDGSYYTGHTDDLPRRIAEHMQGTIPGCYTFRRRPLILKWQQDFPGRAEALNAEQQIKGWSRRKKEALMRGDWQGLVELSQTGKSLS